MPNQYSKLSKRFPIIPIGPSIAYIPLTQGKFSLVDSEDAEFLGQWQWCATNHTKVYGGFRVGRCVPSDGSWNKPRIQFMHLVILPRPDGMVVDHINRNPLDNRRSNLRIVTPKENSANSVHRNQYSERLNPTADN